MDVKTRKKKLTGRWQEEGRQEVPVMEFLVEVCVTTGGKKFILTVIFFTKLVLFNMIVLVMKIKKKRKCSGFLGTAPSNS